MAKLSAFSRDAGRVQEGETIEVGPPGNTFLITTRGFTPRYRDALYILKNTVASRLNRALQPGATRYTAESLPPTEDDRAQGQAIAEHCVLDVDGLQNDDGSEIGIDAFRQLLASGEHPMLIALAISAAAKVGEQRTEDHRDAVGN
ncbi:MULTISPECIES: hypothetical protein [Asaia]|uniref:Uncharacterized protein n=2 Tax=Asaia TaxID=91914 RepID=A0A060QGE0_9PROT|nr:MULTISPECIES: hypothetical protein [Asaia]MDL2172047.1 hypothetical protein [Asaia sp. HumB]CDG39728.1 hypothetical protein ASAP_1683 [Asaia bogorensis]